MLHGCPSEGSREASLAQIAAANLVLLIFNLIPAFPMDGGRVLRGALAIWLGFGRATQVAARIGQGLAIVLAAVGFMGNPLLVLIAIFIFAAAGGEARYVKLRELARGRSVTDAMIAPLETLSVMATADDAAALLTRTAQREVPVLDGAARLRGVVVRGRILDAVKRNRGATPVLELMSGDVPTVAQSTGLEAAIPLLFTSRARCIGVVDTAGRFVGYLTPESVGERLAVRLGPEKRSLGWIRG